jgi:hypothetical protein
MCSSCLASRLQWMTTLLCVTVSLAGLATAAGAARPPARAAALVPASLLPHKKGMAGSGQRDAARLGVAVLDDECQAKENPRAGIRAP